MHAYIQAEELAKFCHISAVVLDINVMLHACIYIGRGAGEEQAREAQEATAAGAPRVAGDQAWQPQVPAPPARGPGTQATHQASACDLLSGTLFAKNSVMTAMVTMSVVIMITVTLLRVMVIPKCL